MSARENLRAALAQWDDDLTFEAGIRLGIAAEALLAEESRDTAAEAAVKRVEALCDAQGPTGELGGRTVLIAQVRAALAGEASS